jgi:hypothetical protein
MQAAQRQPRRCTPLCNTHALGGTPAGQDSLKQLQDELLATSMALLVTMLLAVVRLEFRWLLPVRLASRAMSFDICYVYVPLFLLQALAWWPQQRAGARPKAGRELAADTASQTSATTHTPIAAAVSLDPPSNVAARVSVRPLSPPPLPPAPPHIAQLLRQRSTTPPGSPLRGMSPPMIQLPPGLLPPPPLSPCSSCTWGELLSSSTSPDTHTHLRANS